MSQIDRINARYVADMRAANSLPLMTKAGKVSKKRTLAEMRAHRRRLTALARELGPVQARKFA